MVKGHSRQVILVPSPDPELFEEAIFILKADALGKEGITDRQILRQAQEAAGAYLPHGKKKSAAPFWAAAGAAFTGVIWLFTLLL